MTTKFFTNEDNNTLLRRFTGVFQHAHNIAAFDALVGYFRASGYFAIRPHLEKVPQIRILVGINVDQLIATHHRQGWLFRQDPQVALADFKQMMKDDIQSAVYSKQVEDGMVQFIDDVVSGKIVVKAHPHRTLHAKIYIFRPENFNEYTSGEVITGSSNLTSAGVGTANTSNYEFNVALRDYDDVKFATDEFERLWQEGVDVLPMDVQHVKQQTYLNDNCTPYEVYLKFLIEYFGKSVEFDPNSIADLPDGFKRLSYQIDAVEQGFDLLKRHNGFFLSDVVGLGKTVVATLIAKKFFYFNGFPSHISTTLVVTPPAQHVAWRETLDAFGLKNYQIINNGSLHKVEHPETYDLILVDEAHKFRNDTSDAYNALQKVCKAPSSRRVSDGTNAPKKVILISATPLNNRPSDIRNLVLLFQDGKRSTLEIANLSSFFTDVIERYKQAQKQPLAQARLEVSQIYEQVREKIIKSLTIRRTRTDLMAHDEYKLDLLKQQIVFPQVLPPRHILYQLEPSLEQLYDDTMYILSAAPEQGGLAYLRYQALRYLVAEKKARYQNAEMASRQLAFIMKTLLVKRIDSSFTAFKGSLNRFLDASAAMLKMFNQSNIFIAPNLNVSEYIMENREDELLEKIVMLMETDPSVMICTPADFEPGFVDGLQKDHALLQHLAARWNDITDDPKFDTFYHELQTRLLNPTDNPQQKLIIFSESRETTHYLADRLKAAGRNDALEVHAGNSKETLPIVRANFDANIPIDKQQHTVNIVITTEVLAEGVNLHRANTIVNYDTPWNATRLMQRVGRVNRIGSIAPSIFIYNFYPTAKVDNDIELKKKAITKLQAFHSALGEDSQIYSTEEEVETFGIFEDNPEESRDERLAYLMELRDFKRQHPQEFKRIQQMPLRTRTGRRSRLLHGGTLCFIKNQHRDAFFLVDKEGQVIELTFLDMANALRAVANEKAVALHANHHAHVRQAVDAFWQQVETERTTSNVVDSAVSPQDKSALAYLAAFRNLPETSDAERAYLLAAQNAIKVHRYNQLSKQVNTLKKSATKMKMHPDTILEKLMAIVTSFPLQTGDNEPIHHTAGALQPAPIKREEEPDIIISESFTR